MSSSKAAKAMKNIAIAATAQDSHTGIKIKNLLRWLKSGHEVRVQINGKADRHKVMDSIFLQIQREVKSGANVLQKVVKPESIKFYLRPTENAADIVIDDSRVSGDVDDISEITTDKDILSDDFEKELIKSIKEERTKTKKK